MLRFSSRRRLKAMNHNVHPAREDSDNSVTELKHLFFKGGTQQNGRNLLPTVPLAIRALARCNVRLMRRPSSNFPWPVVGPSLDRRSRISWHANSSPGLSTARISRVPAPPRRHPVPDHSFSWCPESIKPQASVSHQLIWIGQEVAPVRSCDSSSTPVEEVTATNPYL